MNKKATLNAEIIATLIKNDGETCLLTLRVDEKFSLLAQPGMFSAFLPQNGYTQRRPFSIAGIEVLSQEASYYAAHFVIKCIGPNSVYFSNLKKGEKINITYPRGKEIQVKDKVKNYILVAGSVGIAPLTFLSEKIVNSDKKIIILEGAKKPFNLIGKHHFENQNFCNYKCITEENLLEEKSGLVTDLLSWELENLNEEVEVIACGPLPMMKAVSKICAHENIPCQVILESVFACNQGACLGCATFMTDGTTRHICKDGPAFYANELDWEKLMNSHFTPCGTQKTLSCNLENILEGQDGKKLILNTPVIAASGTQSLHSLTKGHIDISKIGAILTKGLTLEPTTGNPAPRVCETPAGMLNSIGLENIGLEAFLADELPPLLVLDKPIIANINGGTMNQYVGLAVALDQTNIAAIEINISCPNVKEGGMAFGVSVYYAHEVVKAVRKVTDKFLIVKLTPNVTNIAEVAETVRLAGADAISAINTISAMAIDIHSRRPKLGNIIGGLSGPAIKPIGVKMVRDLFNADLGIPIIGIGGITNADDALEYLIAGAKAVQIGTASFKDEMVFTDTVNGIKEYMLCYGFENINKLSGSLII